MSNKYGLPPATYPVTSRNGYQRNVYVPLAVDVAMALSTATVSNLAPAAQREASYALLLLGSPIGYHNNTKLD